MPTRLSSDFLFHYKRDFEVLKLILEKGFRHTRWRESLPYGNAKQENFLCCFCDILPEQAESHRACYGDYAIVLNKAWGIKNGISPVRYIHPKSPGALTQYVALKNLWRETSTVVQTSIANPVERVCALIKRYMLFSMMVDMNLIHEGQIQKSFGNDPSLHATLAQLHNSLDAITACFPTQKTGDDFLKFMGSIMNRLIELHNELERRDAFCRAYTEDFTNSAGELIQGKVLYDEREWRSIRMIEEVSDGSHVQKAQEASVDGYLPHEYNLRFEDKDVVFVVVRSDTEKAELIEYLKSKTCLLNASVTASKITTFSALLNAQKA